MPTYNEEDPTKRPYVYSITEMSAFEITKEPMRIISAVDMLGMCSAFLDATQCHTSGRWPLSKESRRELGRKIEWNCPQDWKAREEWSGHVRNALQILSQRDQTIRISQQDQWQTWEELETDIHISARCSRQTVEFYRAGNPQHLPNSAELFAVPVNFSKFVSSILSGDIRPVWTVWHADAASMPGCCDGIYPRYAPLK